MRERKETRLMYLSTRVQRRSSLERCVMSQGFIYLRLGKVQNDDKANRTQWNMMEL